MALDWDYEKERLYGFESFKDKDIYIDVMTALPDNSKVLMWNNRRKKLYSLTRTKQKGKYDRVYESWAELKLAQKLPNYLEQLKQDGEELDLLDEISFWIYDKVSSFDKMAKRHEFVNTIADEVSEKIFGVKQDLS